VQRIVSGALVVSPFVFSAKLVEDDRQHAGDKDAAHAFAGICVTLLASPDSASRTMMSNPPRASPLAVSTKVLEPWTVAHQQQVIRQAGEGRPGVVDR
jgi:hypothetical protein